jgi:hypothetical protein
MLLYFHMATKTDVGEFMDTDIGEILSQSGTEGFHRGQEFAACGGEDTECSPERIYKMIKNITTIRKVKLLSLYGFFIKNIV